MSSYCFEIPDSVNNDNNNSSHTHFYFRGGPLNPFPIFGIDYSCYHNAVVLTGVPRNTGAP